MPPEQQDIVPTQSPAPKAADKGLHVHVADSCTGDSSQEPAGANSGGSGGGGTSGNSDSAASSGGGSGGANEMSVREESLAPSHQGGRAEQVVGVVATEPLSDFGSADEHLQRPWATVSAASTFSRRLSTFKRGRTQKLMGNTKVTVRRRRFTLCGQAGCVISCAQGMHALASKVVRDPYMMVVVAPSVLLPLVVEFARPFLELPTWIFFVVRIAKCSNSTTAAFSWHLAHFRPAVFLPNARAT